MFNREELDYAMKFPFTKKAKDIVQEAGFELDAPPIQVIDRAKQRVKEDVNGSFQLVKSSSEQTLLTDLFSYPVSKILVSLTKDRSIKQKFATAESKRLFQELNKEKDPELTKELASQLDIIIKENKINFTDYVKAAPRRNPLVNSPLKNGFVEVNDEMLAEIVANTLQVNLETEFRRTLKVPKLYETHAKEIKTELMKNYASEDLGPLKIASFPPCINHLIQDARAGDQMPHQARFVLSTFLVNVGMPTENIVAMFSNTPNFNAKKTRYYVEYSAGKRGSGVKYSPPSCKKMDFYGLCRGKDSLCTRIGHPIRYYRTKKRSKQ